MEKICEGNILQMGSIDDSMGLWGTLRTTKQGTHITSKVLLLAQDGLISIEFAFKLAKQFLHTLLIRYSAPELLEYLLFGNSRRDRIKICILDASRLLEFGMGLGLSGDQLCAGSEGRQVPSDSARLVQLESVILLNIQRKKESCQLVSA